MEMSSHHLTASKDAMDELKIHESKICRLNLDDQNYEKEYVEKQVLYVESENLSELINLNLNFFSKIYVINVKLNFEVDESEVLSIFSKTVITSQEMFLQLQIMDSFKAFYKQKDSNEFKGVNDCANPNTVQFFETLNSQQKLTIDADFYKVFNKTRDEYIKQEMKDAMNSKKKSYLKLLSLYLNESLVKSILLEIASLGNVNTIEIDMMEKRILSKDNVKKLHENIKNGNINEVRQFVEDFPHFKLCMLSTCNALTQSIKSKNVEIFELLYSKNFIPYDKEVLLRVIEEQDEDFRVKIEDIMNSCFKECSENYLNLLASKCIFYQQNYKEKSVENSEKSRNIFKRVYSIEGGEFMIKILSQSDVKIVFDLKNESLSSMTDKDSGFVGLCEFHKKKINVAMGKDENDCVATFGHEMTHYICNLIYDNFALPYCKHDSVRETEFDLIFKEVKRTYESDQEKSDGIIANIFKFYAAKNPNNNEEVKKAEITQKTELISRVVELLTLYQHDCVRFKEIKKKFSNLFNFYSTKFLSDLKIPNIYEMIKLNKNFGLLDSIENSKWQTNLEQNYNLLNKVEKITLLVSKTPQLALSRVLNELKQFSIQQPDESSQDHQNSICALNFKVKTIFINPNELKHLNKDLKSLIKSSCVEKIVSIADENLTEFDDKVQYILVVDETDSKIISKLKNESINFTRQKVNFEWTDLSEETQKFIKDIEVNFQGHKIKIEELFDEPQKSLNSDAIKVLLENIKTEKPQIQEINCKPSEVFLENFIPRVIEKISKHWMQPIELNTNNFILDSRKTENFQNIVLISDPAGSGKTFLFKKICDDLKNAENEIQKQECKIKSESETQNSEDKKKMIFPLFFPLKSHLDVLKKFKNEESGSAQDKFVEFVSKMAKFDGLTKAVFVQKFAKGETMIFFDAFDEISPDCPEETKNLIQLFQETLKNPKNVEKEVQNEKKRNQIFISTRTHFEKELEQKLEVLASKIKPLSQKQQIDYLTNTWKKSNKSNLDIKFIKSSAEKLVNKITKVIESMKHIIGIPIILQSIAEYYSKKISTEIFSEIENLNIFEIYEKITIYRPQDVFEEIKHEEKILDSPLCIHHFFAIKNLLGEKFTKEMKLSHKKEWKLEKIQLFGIATYESNKVYFNHETYAEFLVAYKLFEILEYNVDEIKFLIEVMTNENLKLPRIFLDAKLGAMENYKEIEFGSQEICNILEESPDLLNRSCQERLFCVFEFFMNLIYKNDAKMFVRIIESDSFEKVMVLAFAKKTSKIEDFIDKIMNVGISSEDFLKKSKILHFFAQYSKHFESLWAKCEELVKSDNKLKEIFTQRNLRGQNLLQLSIFNIENPKAFQVIFNLASTKYFKANKEELKKFLIEEDYEKECVMTTLAKNGCAENLNFFLDEIRTIFESEILKEILKVKGDSNLLTITALYNSEESNVILREFFGENLKLEEICQMIREKDLSGNNFFHKICRFSKSQQDFEYFVLKMKEYFNEDPNRFQEFLLEKNFDGLTALQYCCYNESLEILRYVLYEIYFAYFSNPDDFIFDYFSLAYSIPLRNAIFLIDFWKGKNKDKIKDKINFHIGDFIHKIIGVDFTDDLNKTDVNEIEKQLKYIASIIGIDLSSIDSIEGTLGIETLKP